MRIAVIADPHLSVLRDGTASWHNPYRLADADDRLDAALADPLFNDADVFAILGDLAHFGDRESIRRCIDAVAEARGDRPSVLLGGNHDVLVEGVNLDDELEPWCDGTDAAKVFESSGLGLQVQIVTALTTREVYAFDVDARTLAAPGPAGLVVFTHFPLLSLRRRARAANLLYSGHLSDLAPPVAALPTDLPVVVLSGHLHLRGVAHEGDVLQLSFAALVEAPYELARVDIQSRGDGLVLEYQCASARPPDAEKLPVLDPPAGRWLCRPGHGWQREPARND
ncbi:MAG TPA: metallophosphoesterase [Acidimicrobiales bacterium]|nr:metallophosphoesterase [Acidimicrobiales bacterium]